MQKAFTLGQINSITNTLIGVSHACMPLDNSFVTIAEYMKEKCLHFSEEEIPWGSTDIFNQRKKLFPELWNWVESQDDWDSGWNFPIKLSKMEHEHTFRELLHFFGLRTFENPLGGFVGSYNARIPRTSGPEWFDPRFVHRYERCGRQWQIIATDRTVELSGLPMLLEDPGFALSKECDELLGRICPEDIYELHVNIGTKIGSQWRGSPCWIPESSMEKFRSYWGSTETVYYDESGLAIARQSDIVSGNDCGWINQTRLMRRKEE